MEPGSFHLPPSVVFSVPRSVKSAPPACDLLAVRQPKVRNPDIRVKRRITPSTMLSRLPLAVISGIFLALAFAPYGLSLLSWFAFIPLLYAIEGCGLFEVLAIAWLQQLAFCLTSGSWVFSTLHDYARLSATRSVIEFAILSLMLAVFGAFAVAIAKLVSERLSVPMFLTL